MPTKIVDTTWIGVGGLSFLGMSVNDWILIAALVFGFARAVDALIVLYRRIRKSGDTSESN
jgi:preprotein translocase subunit SecD